jgi:hypothetical protein
MNPAQVPVRPADPNGFADGLGHRSTVIDPTTGETLEILQLRADLTGVPAFEFALRERAARLVNFRHEDFARVRRIDRTPDGSLAVVSDHVAGRRLSEILAAAADRRLALDVGAAFCLVRQLVPAVAFLHDNARDVAHGAIALERLVVTPHGRLVIMEHVVGSALEQLRFSREQLWRECRVAMPSSAGAPRFDHHADVTQLGMVVLQLVLGRPLKADEYPMRITQLVDSATIMTAGGERRPLPMMLHTWFNRTLHIDLRRAYASGREAQAALEQMISVEPQFVAAPVALETFLARLAPGAPAAAPHAAAAAYVPTPPIEVLPAAAALTPPPPPAPRGAVVPPPAASIPVPDAFQPTPTTTGIARPPAAAATPPAGIPAPKPPVAAAPPAPIRVEATPRGTPALTPPLGTPALTPPLGTRALTPPLGTRALTPPTGTPALTPPLGMPAPARFEILPAAADIRTAPQARVPEFGRFQTFEPTEPRTRRGRSSLRTVAALLVTVGILCAGGVFAMRQFFSGGAAETQANGPLGTLSIQSRPAGVQVFVDGQARGLTPARISLRPGPHIVELRGRGAPRVLPVTIGPGGQVSQYVELAEASAPVTGELDVRSDPPGARVTIDGHEAGVAPVVISNLQPGEHTIALHNEHGTVRHTVTIQPGLTAALVAPMAAGPISGWIRIAAPFAMSVYEHGQLVGSSESDRIMLPAGQHQLEVVNETLSFRSTQIVQVAAGKVTPLGIELPNGLVNLNAAPWAEVWIDGKSIGETPIGNLSLPIGPHEVVFRHPTLGERRHAVSVTLAGPVRLSVDMNQP